MTHAQITEKLDALDERITAWIASIDDEKPEETYSDEEMDQMLADMYRIYRARYPHLV